MSTAISTDSNLNVLSFRDLMMASSILMQTRNSKGRIVPLHLTSAPGVGKTDVVGCIAEQQARDMPGVPFGFRVFNAQIASPTDLSIVLFDDVVYPEGHPRAGQRDKVSRYTLPAVFGLSCVYVSDPSAEDPASAAVEVVERDVLGQPIYPGSMILCPFTGATLPVQDGMIFLDEFAQADPEVRKALAPLVDEGRVANYRLPEGFAVWLASNRAKDMSGVGKALAFLTNRWIEVGITADKDGFMSYLDGRDGVDTMALDDGFLSLSRPPLVDSKGLWRRRAAHGAVKAFVENNYDSIHAGVPADPSRPFATRRSVTLVSNLCDIMLVRDGDPDDSDSTIESGSLILGEDDPVRMRIFTALAAGAIGSDLAAEFVSTLSLYGETPSIAEVAADPTKAHVSPRNDAQIIMSYKIAQGMNLKNGNALIRYAQRMNPIFLANTIINAVTRNGDLLTVSLVAKFFNDNPDAMHRMVAARARAAGAGINRRTR